MLRVITAGFALVALTCSAVTGTEWVPMPTAKDGPFVMAGFKHDDGGALYVWCNTKVRLISILIEEPVHAGKKVPR